MGFLLDGKSLACIIRNRLAQQVKTFIAANGWTPHLALLLIGDDPASHIYVAKKVDACHEVGLKVSVFKEADTITETGLLALVKQLNEDSSVQGIVVQLPLPPHLNLSKIIQSIEPIKDVDGLHPTNYGKMASGHAAHIPATPLGVLLLLAYYKIETVGKHCVVLGRGPTVGAPLSILLARKSYPGNATVTLCHSQTKNLASFTRQADVLLTAVGTPHLVTGDWVKPGATVVDIGISRIADNMKKSGYRLVGDVDLDAVIPHCHSITPVPGGVGPMTVVTLLLNTFRAANGWVYTQRGSLAAIIQADLPPGHNLP